ncbi:periplasmic sensor hybrid histidine kinase [Caballeronia arationis]|jgi:signal transduction histidine kinase/CheY-like chemotaxis protein|uniref:histidine kinase n=1 Tax=Caballeronia arationis TaxID=1777142 RepID=A0A7Z7ICE1_9BURK|nr:hybrid sensor histidine kinase/response regulator [Caballeronia arationis]SAK69020.1 periplasmic sensor hybrid histidine kinase [Caballeronia arationis]SOE88055.1 Signal transduction histidine kinase [Caballeronia arationis]
MSEHREVSALDSSALEIPVPPRDFGATRRILIVVLLASIVTPLFFIIGYGYVGYESRLSDSSEVIDRLARVAEEHAVKVLDLNREMSSRIEQLLGSDNDQQVLSRQEEVHQILGEMAARLPQIAGIFVFGENGDLLVSSNYFPAPRVNVRGRVDFEAVLKRDSETEVSMPLRDAISGTDVFTTNTARRAADGRFLGLVTISLRRDYFLSFYKELAARDSALTLGLFRRDGAILARSPPPRVKPAPARNLPLARAIEGRGAFDRIRIDSTLDGVDKLLAYRQVGTYPLYVTAGIAVSAVTSRWLQHDGLIALATLIPCTGIWLLVVFSLRRLKEEQAAWERWRTEVGMRLTAEATSRQMRRMGALGNLVANVAHDFNNLLMVVKANMELARRKGFNGLEKEVTAVERASVGAEVLARRLLSVARKQPLREDATQLSGWLGDAASLIETSLGAKVELTLHAPETVWPVYVDATELESALINIAVNAKDAMPEGGEFVIRCENVHLLQASSGLKPGDYVVIACSDNGSGMPPAVAQRAFEPLFTTKATSAGTGLGLAQVFAMCEQAGGTARVDSVVDRGTTIRLFLPRWTGEARREAVDLSKPENVAEVANQGSVLLVEDNVEVAAGLAAVLEVFGWRARHELTGDAALQLLEDGERFDLILSDIQMPGLNNGIDVAEKVRRAWPHQAIALMTGYAEEFERAKHAGVTILSKPFNIDDLQALLQRVHVSTRTAGPGTELRFS